MSISKNFKKIFTSDIKAISIKNEDNPYVYRPGNFFLSLLDILFNAYDFIDENKKRGLSNSKIFFKFLKPPLIVIGGVILGIGIIILTAFLFGK